MVAIEIYMHMQKKAPVLKHAHAESLKAVTELRAILF